MVSPQTVELREVCALLALLAQDGWEQEAGWHVTAAGPSPWGMNQVGGRIEWGPWEACLGTGKQLPHFASAAWLIQVYESVDALALLLRFRLIGQSGGWALIGFRSLQVMLVCSQGCLLSDFGGAEEGLLSALLSLPLLLIQKLVAHPGSIWIIMTWKDDLVPELVSPH